MKAKIVKEITFYLSNQAGQLGKITRELASAGVSINGLLVSEGFGKSVVRTVVEQDHHDKALEILEGLGIDDVTENQVLEVLLPSKIGVLAELSEIMGKANINMDNIYVTESTAGDTISYVSVPDVEEGLKAFDK